MARTTLVLDDNLLKQMKKKAADEGRSLQAVVNELIRRGLATRPHHSYRLKLQGWKAQLQPGIDILDRNSLFEAMDRK
jgi:plasmid stability protein